jgi:hypothetical protein
MTELSMPRNGMTELSERLGGYAVLVEQPAESVGSLDSVV